MSLTHPNRVVVLTELYYPEKTSTGRILGRLATGLATSIPVQVLCGQPQYDLNGSLLAESEIKDGVRIRRCKATRLNRHRLLFRAINAITLTLSLGFRLLFCLRRGDVVLTVTNPPLLPYLAALICAFRRVPCHLLVHDVYPECLSAVGLLKKDSLCYRVLDQLSCQMYHSMASVITIGRDMQALIQHKTTAEKVEVAMIPNWADDSYLCTHLKWAENSKVTLGFGDKFLVVYAGNLGRTHDVEILAELAKRLEDNPRFQLVVAGSGAKRSSLEACLHSKNIENVTLLAGLSEERFQMVVASADINIITFIPGMKGISVPSRAYNALAAGSPLVLAADSGGEIGQLIDEFSLGWCVPAGDADTLESVVRMVMERPELCVKSGQRARKLALDRFSFENALSLYLSLLQIKPLDDTRVHRRAA